MRFVLWAGMPLLFLLGSCSSVETKKVDETHFELVTFYNEPPRALSSSALISEAGEVCPEGYEVLSKTAGKSGDFGVDDAQCTGYKSCDYVLQWRIVCVDKPQEAFSIFGNK